MSAFAMAVLLNGMSRDETVYLTQAMLDSGEQLSWPGDHPVVDKHSTGGIGDKVSIPLAPMLACCDVQVPMISGRGLGPTGGTLDKLESIPGFRTDLSIEEIKKAVKTTGCVITGATPDIAPADRKLYALRDVTGTVESIPLITASILSKKMAAGLDALVLDVKFGSGAFMKTIEQATALAKSLVSVANQLGAKTAALLTDMNQVLGNWAGNSVEVIESRNMLEGNGSSDLVEITLALGSELLCLVNQQSLAENRTRLQKTISDGSALAKFNEMVKEQGGRDAPHLPETIAEVAAPSDGFLFEIDARQIGFAVIELGGGRKTKTDELDLNVGIEQVARLGDPLSSGQTVFRIASSSDVGQERINAATDLLRKAFSVRPEPPQTGSLVFKVIRDE